MVSSIERTGKAKKGRRKKIENAAAEKKTFEPILRD